MSSNEEHYCVAIIGAGVSGLVSAVKMLKVGIQPTVFDQASDIGGMWNVHLKPCWNSMQTNISKFSTMLADFPWPKDASLFPSQDEVYQHLQNYVQHFLPREIFQLSTTVIRVHYAADQSRPWTVQYRTESNETFSTQFDFVVVASGFFNVPHIPKDIVDLSLFPGTVMHSSDYRSSEQVRDKRVILIGGSMSAAEIGADMAMNAKQIIHVASCNFLSLPRYLPLLPTDPRSPFLPIDCVLYHRSTRTVNHEIIFRSAHEYKRINDFYRSMTDNRQRSSRLVDQNDERMPFITISNMYSEWNRAGKIILQQGRLKQVQKDGTLIFNDGTHIVATNEDILMLCTGFRPNLDFFPMDVLEQLSYKPDDLFSPVILHRCMFHPGLRNLAFVGMYRGLFWGVAELQAQWVAAIFAGLLPAPSVDVQQAGLEIERQIRAQTPRPSFPHGDYVGMVNDLAKEIFGTVPSSMSDVVSPINYLLNQSDASIFDEMNDLYRTAERGRFVAGAVFRALHESQWTFERIVTRESTSVTTDGQAKFHALKKRSGLLYSECSNDSDSKITNFLDSLSKLIYDYNEHTDLITVYFHNEDSVFHTIQMESESSLNPSPAGWIGSGQYLSSDGQCTISYLFIFRGIFLAQFELTYTFDNYQCKTIYRVQEEKTE